MAEGWEGIALRTDKTKEAERNPWLFACTQPNCYFRVCAKSEEEARHAEATHKCPSYPSIKYSWEITVTLVEKLWAMADKAYEDFITADLSVMDGDKYNQLKGRLRGICDSLAVFMVPHFTTGDEIGREVVKRSKVKLAGDTEYETPGLGGRRLEMPAASNPRQAEKSKPAPKPVIEATLTDSNKKAILFALESGMFTEEQVAKTYSVSVDTVRALRPVDTAASQ